MSITVDEIGTIAAENVSTILASDPEKAWRKLVEGGWATLGADPDADIGMREVQEIARVVGRHEVATPLLTTLLAGRWFNTDAEQLAAGVTIAVPEGAGAVAPYAVPDVIVLDGEGGALASDSIPSATEHFAALMPLAVRESGTPPLGPGHAAELHAVLAAAAVGCADAVLDRSVAWVQTREQFGRPISSFQAVRHHLADMHIAREQAWTAALAAGLEPDGAADWSRIACDLAITCIETGIQVHGGVGFTAEVGLQLFLNHVLQARRVLAVLDSGQDAR